MAKQADDIKSTALTLRFKHTFYTILLFAEPTQSFPKIASELLETLHERYPEGLPNDPKDSHPDAPKIPIPNSILELVFGIPQDRANLNKGYNKLDEKIVIESTHSPRSLGINHDGVLAFAFVPEGKVFEGEFVVNHPDLDELYPSDQE